MKNKSQLSALFAALAVLAVLALTVGTAQATTYTFTPTAAGTYPWTTAGNWDANGVPASATTAGVTFFANTTTALANGTLTINSDPAALTLNTLTLNGKGPTGTADALVNIGTAGYTWTFDGTTPTITLSGTDGTSKALFTTVTPNIVLNQNLLITGNGTAAMVQSYRNTGPNFAGNISGSGYGITKNGSTMVELSGNNSYSGGTVINAGGIYIGNANALGTGSLTFGGNGKVIPLYNGNLTIANSVTVNPGVTAEFNVVNSYYKLTLSSPLAGSGTVYVNNSDSGGTGQVTLSSAANTFTGTIQMGGAIIGNLIVNSLPDSANPIQIATSASSGGGGLFQLGAGTATPLVFNSRQIQLTSSKNYSAIINSANASVANTITINTDLAVTGTGNHTLQLGGANTGNNAFNGKIVNGTGTTLLTKADAGRWIVSGANTYTGITTVSGGTLSLPSIDVATNPNPLGQSANTAGSLLLGNGTTLRYTGGAASTDRGFTVNGTSAGHQATLDASGTGAINFTSTASPAYGTAAQTRTLNLIGYNTGNNTLAANIGDNTTGAVSLNKSGIGTWVLSGANAFTGATAVSGGGTLILDYSSQDNRKLGSTGASAPLTLSGGTVTLKNGTSTEAVLSTTLNTAGTFLTRSGSGTGKLRLNAITRAVGGTIDFADATIADTDTSNINGILGGWATLGTDWAISTTGAADTAITALASYTGTLPLTGGANTDNDTLTGPQTQSGAVLANTVKIANSGNGDTLALGANNLTITYTSATSLGGILYVGGGDNNYNITGTGKILTTSATGELIVNVATGTLKISAPFVATGATAGILTKTGAGTLIADTANTYTGATYVNQGVLRLRNATASGSTAGGIAVRNGAALELDYNISVGAEALNPLVGTGISNGGALRNVSGSGNTTYGGAVTIGAGGARINSDSGGTLILTAGVTTALFQDVTIGGDGNVTVQTVALSGAGSLVKDGAGTVSIAASMNTYSGDTTISAGTLTLNSANANSGGSTVTIAATGATLNLPFSGTVTVKRLVIGTTPVADGVYSASTTSQITGTGTVTVNSGATVPKLTGASFVDNKSGGPIVQGTQVTYTVTFNEDMDATTVTTASFANAGTSTITVDSVAETTTTSGIFTVKVTPTTPGTLQLQVPAGAVLKDNAGNALNTMTAIADDTTITVNSSDTTPPTLAGIVDNKGGGPILPNTLVTYTVTFSEAMAAGTVVAGDFDNAGTADCTIGTVSQSAAAVFTVQATPTGGGTLRLRIKAGAVLTDLAGNHLDTTSAILDDTTITVDGTPPTLGSIVDNKGGGPVPVNTLVTYTVTFNEDMDGSTVTASDFGNAGSAAINIGTVTETAPTSGIFTVPVTPTSTGTLQLQVNAGADLRDVVGNALVTSSAIPDDTTITVTPDTTAPTPDPMTWASVPAPTGTSSIAMTAATATDLSGVEYSFECTAGGGHNSGWQNSPTYTDTGLAGGTTYTYRVQARDKSSAQNATGFSTAASATTYQAGTFSSSATPPTVDGADIANLVASTGSDKWFGYDTSQLPTTAAKGQTFNTGVKPTLLKAITYKCAVGNRKPATPATPTIYNIRVGTVSGTTFTVVAGAVCSQTFTNDPGSYMTWTFASPVSLLANTTYAIDVAMTTAGLAWNYDSPQSGIPYLEISGNTYPGGQLYNDNGTGTTAINATANQDRVFHLDMDLVAPTLTSIVDDQSGGPVAVNSLVTYTVTFSKDMDASTIDASDFGNAGTAPITIGTVTETTPTSGIFTVPVTPTSGGTLQLQVNAGAELKSAAGYALDTTSAILDDTTITVGPNHAPVAPSVHLAVSTDKNTAATIYLAKLVAGATDVDSPPQNLTVTAVSSTSTPHGGTVLLETDDVKYTPATGYTGPDSFTYTISDNGSPVGTVVGTVDVTVNDTSSGGGLNVVVAEQRGSDFYVQFAGIPGCQYRIKYSASANGPYVDFSPDPVIKTAGNTAGSMGLFEFHEPMVSGRFYKTTYESGP